jgi:hypothetical protein
MRRPLEKALVIEFSLVTEKARIKELPGSSQFPPQKAVHPASEESVFATRTVFDRVERSLSHRMLAHRSSSSA